MIQENKKTKTNKKQKSMISRLRTNLQSPPLVLLHAMHKVNTYHFDIPVAKRDEIEETVAASGCGKAKIKKRKRPPRPAVLAMPDRN